MEKCLTQGPRFDAAPFYVVHLSQRPDEARIRLGRSSSLPTTQASAVTSLGACTATLFRVAER